MPRIVKECIIFDKQNFSGGLFSMQKFISAILLAAILLVPSAVFAEDEKSAVLVVSFGTSLPEARHAINSLADSARKEFPKCEVRLAFTSNIIRRKITRESGESIPNPWD